MKARFAHLLFAMLVAGCAPEKPPPAAPPPTMPTATALPAPVLVNLERPIVLIYRDGHNIGVPASERLQTAVWGDGRIVWRGERGLLAGRVDPARINQLLQRLHELGVYGNGDVFFASIGPDATFDVIEIRLHDRSFKLASWHERFAQNPRLVVRSTGVESLQGRDPAAVLAEDTPEYQRFRQVWSEIRTAVREWPPAEGEAFTEEVPLVGG